MFSRMRSEGFPFIVWGSGGWTLVRLELLVASASGRRRVVVASLIPCLWGKLQNLSFSKVSTQLSCRFAWQALHFVTFQPACYRVESFKLEEVSHQMLVLLRPRVSSRVSAFPLASPCLWGKLQNLLRFAASTPRVSSRVSAFPLTSPCLWGEAAKPQSLLFLLRRRVYGGSCKTLLVLLSLVFRGVAVSRGSFRRFPSRLSCQIGKCFVQAL